MEAIVEVPVPGGAYRVRIGEGVLDALSEEARAIAPLAVALVADREVSRHHGERVRTSLGKTGARVVDCDLDPGEASKSPENLTRLWSAFARGGLDRGSLVVALGGGVVSDLAGFAAATFHRGVSWVACPTTLLAQVDAAVGGKTAVNLPEGKNLAGAFHHPRVVLADLGVLDTLPAAELETGFAEVVKAGAVGDAVLLAFAEARAKDLLARARGPLAEAVRRAVAVKAAFVSRDERDEGERRALNFGHTVGHALEKASGFALPHGRAISVGMLAACEIARRRGRCDGAPGERIAAALAALRLPTRLPPGIGMDAVLDALPFDKKARAGRLVFALPRGIGRVEVVEGIEREEVAEALAALA